jgi:translation initiation factor 1A
MKDLPPPKEGLQGTAPPFKGIFFILAMHSKRKSVIFHGVRHLANNTRKKPGGGEEPAIIRVRLPNKRNNEMFGMADLMLGANHIRVKCFDGVTRVGRIKGKIKKRVWIREGDVLIVIPWSFQDEKCDIVYRYTGPQVEWLRRNGYL